MLGQPPSPARDGGKPRGVLGGSRGLRFRGGGAKMPFVLPIRKYRLYYLSVGPIWAEVRPLIVTQIACGEHERVRDVSPVSQRGCAGQTGGLCPHGGLSRGVVRVREPGGRHTKSALKSLSADRPAVDEYAFGKKSEVLEAIRAALKREIGEGPVCLGAATWIVSAYTS
jgi:hypothetical protein